MNPAKSLAVTLDVGTDNENLLNDNLYVVGLRFPFVVLIVTSKSVGRDGRIGASVGKNTTGLLTSMSGKQDKHNGPHALSNRFVQLVRKYHPHSLLHFEDFGTANAGRLLEKYRDKHAVFNDDMSVYFVSAADDFDTIRPIKVKALEQLLLRLSWLPLVLRRPNSWTRESSSMV